MQPEYRLNGVRRGVPFASNPIMSFNRSLSTALTLNGGLTRMLRLVSFGTPDIIVFMPALLKTNPYLRNVRLRRRMITDTARQSSYFEGARGLRLKVHVHVSSKRRVMASAKKSAKAS